MSADPYRRHYLLQAACAVALGILVASGYGQTTDQPGTVMATEDALTDKGQQHAIRIGFNGYAKAGHWTPVQLRLFNDTRLTEPFDQVQVVLPDSDGSMCAFPLNALRLESAGPTEPAKTSEDAGSLFEGYVRLGQLPAAITVTINGTDIQLPFSEDKVIRGTQRLVLVVGGKIGVADALRMRTFSRETSARTTQVNFANLPTSLVGYDGVDAVVLTTGGDASWLELAAADDARWQALDSWVRQGGKLLLSIGVNGEKVASAGKPLAKLLPGTFRSVIRQRNTSELETFTGSNESLANAWLGKPRDQQGVPMTLLDDVRGLVVVSEGSGKSIAPWVIRSACGFGSVTYVGCDLNSGPVANWANRTRLIASLMDESLMHQSIDGEQNARGKLTHFGFNDLSGQLRAGMEQFAGVRLIPYSLIAALAIGYIFLIGPVDFFLLKKLAPRMEWTWLTFPLMIIAVTIAAVTISRDWKGAAACKNVVDMLDADAESGRIRCTSWAHFYYPESGKYDVSVEPVDTFGKEDGVTVSWQGLPGPAFGGMENRAAILSTGMAAPYTNTVDRITELPAPQWSSRSLAATWWKTAKSGKSELKVNREELLSGPIENPLPFDIKKAAICYGRSYYQIGDFAAGATFEIDELAQPRDFRYRLTRRRIANDRELIEPWNKENLNIPRIMEMIMFHDKAGGRSYTDLWSRYHHELDMSDHLDTGAAVLYGTIAKPASNWKSTASHPEQSADVEVDDAHKKQWTFCRILYPVKVNTQSRFRPQRN